MRACMMQKSRRYLESWMASKTSEVEAQTAAFKHGLCDVIPSELLSLFTADELQELLSGAEEIDDAALADWKANSSASAQVPQIIKEWFWAAMQSYSPDERSAVLEFATGARSPPSAAIGGFRHSQACTLQCPLSHLHGHIACCCSAMRPQFRLEDGGDAQQDGRRCVSMLCDGHHHIRVPHYSSKEMLTKMVLQSCKEGLASGLTNV